MWGLNDVLTYSIAYGMGEEEGRAKAEKEKKKESPWHIFNDWNDAPDCESVLVTIENKRFGQRFVTDAWWSVGVDGKCRWYAVNGSYAENWREGIYTLSDKWKVVAWMYWPEPYKEASK